MGIKNELTKDLSAYMQPEPWNIDIKPNSVGINVSGLAYSNGFRTLAGQFDAYPELIDRLICHFRDKGHTIYLIPHSYNYEIPEPNNDDMVACKAAYDKLKDKSNVIFVDKDLISPQVKYVISKMSFSSVLECMPTLLPFTAVSLFLGWHTVTSLRGRSMQMDWTGRIKRQ